MTEKEKSLLRQQLHRLLDIVIDTNGFECRQKGMTGKQPTVWFDYSGHINHLQLEIAPEGWTSGSGCYTKTLIDAFLEEPFSKYEIEMVERYCEDCPGGNEDDD
jgi:hypothetical protein